MIVDPTVADVFRRAEAGYAETRAKYQDWLWKVCQRDDAGAERARADLVAAIDAQHAAVRGLVAATRPQVRRLTTRPATVDELEE